MDLQQFRQENGSEARRGVFVVTKPQKMLLVAQF